MSKNSFQPWSGRRVGITAGLSLALCLATTPFAHAATYTWTGAGFMGNQDFLWSNPFNWSGLSAPATGETNLIIVLPNNGSPRNTTNDIAGLVVKSIRFQGDNYIVAGKSPATSLALTFDRFSGDTIEATGNNGQFASTLPLVLTNDISVDVAIAKTFHIRSTMGGPGGVTKLDGGTLHFNSIGNNYAGETYVSDGILDLECGFFGATVSVPQALIIGSTNLDFSPVVRLLLDDQIADSAPVTVNRNAKLWLNTHDDSIGSLTLGGGLVNTGQGGNPTSPGTLTLNGNVTNRFTAVGEFSTVSGKLYLGSSTRTFDVATSSQLGIDASIGGNVIFPPGLLKIGGGLLLLYNATNTYGGTTTIDGGAIVVSGSTQLLGNTNAGTVVTTNGQLQLEAFSVGQESLTLNGGLLVSLSYSAANSWAGPVTLNGNCRVQGNDNADDLTFSGVISGTGSLTKQGDGVLHFTGSGANTFSGGLFAAGGFTELEKSASAPAMGAGPVVIGTTNASFPSVYLDVNSNNQIPDSSPITILHGILYVDGTTEAIGNVEFVGGWIVNIGGTLTLSGHLTNRVADQEAAIYGAATLSAGTHIFHGAAGTSFAANGALNGSGAFTKTGPGSITFLGTNSYSGLTLVKDGFLRCFHDGRPGSSAAGTEVESAGVLVLDRTSFTNETLTLHGHPVNYSLYVRDQCSWIGNVSLLGDTGVQFENANGLTNKLTFNGGISGAGGLRSDGEGELIFTGNTDNTFAGTLWFRSSNGRFQKTSGATAVSSALHVGRDLIDGNFQLVTLGANNQIANTAPVRLNASGEIQLGIFNETIGDLTLAGGDFDLFSGLLTLNGNITSVSNISTSYVFGNVSLGGATRTFDIVSGGHVYIDGVIQDGGGAAGITKIGEGYLRFTRLNTYAGPTLINQGRLTLEGVGRPGSAVGSTEIAAGASLDLTDSYVTNELLVLHGTTVFYVNTNEWRGPIELHGTCQFWAFGGGTNEILLVDGTVSGLGSIAVRAGRKFTLAGSSANTFSGTTTLERGTMELKKTSGYAIPGSLIIGGTNLALDAIVQTSASDQFNSNPIFRHTIYPSGQLICGGFDQRVPQLTLIEGSINTVGGVLVLDGDVTVGRSSFPGSGIDGKLSLGSVLAAGATRTFTISNSCNLTLFSSVMNGANTTNLWHTGGGHLFLHESNSFSGTFTVEDGSVFAYNSDAFGKSSGGTTVKTNGYLTITDLGTAAKPVAEPFTFEGTAPYAFSLTAYGTNHLSGPLAIQGPFISDIESFSGSNALMVLSGPVSGNGSYWSMQGNGTYRLTGTNDNTFSGNLNLYYAQLELSKTNAVAVAGPLNVGSEFGQPETESVRWLRTNQIGDTTAVTVNESGKLELLNNDDAIGSLAGVGKVFLGLATLTTGSNNTSTTYGGFIAGIGGKLTKTGAGTFTLTTNNSYTGATTVNGGVLLVHGQQSQSAVSLLTGGTIGGNGRVGSISALNGHVAPGASPGKLSSGNLSFFSPSSLLKIEINGTNAGVNFDQVDVTGSVLLMGGALQISMNFAGAISNQYVIVNNDGVDAVSGTFTALPEGGSITNNGFVFTISYHGGDGNDIVLTQQNVAIGPQIGTIQKLGDGTIKFTGTGLPDTTYTVEATVNLNPPVQWDELGTVNSDVVGFMEFIDLDAAHFPIRFYRFRLP